MRILMSSESYWPNNDGGAVFERRLVHQLLDAGHQVAHFWVVRALAQCFGEAMFCVALGQLERPGSPAILGNFLSSMSLRSVALSARQLRPVTSDIASAGRWWFR